MKLIKLPVFKYKEADPVTGEQEPYGSYINANPALLAAVWTTDEGLVFFVLGPDTWRTPISEKAFIELLDKSSTYSLN